MDTETMYKIEFMWIKGLDAMDIAHVLELKTLDVWSYIKAWQEFRQAV